MALISAVAGLRQLDAGKYLVPACRLRLGKIRVEAKAEVGAINGGVLEVQGMHRKLLPGLRVGDVLVSQRIEAVIGAYKEILAGDMRGIVKGRFVAYNGLCEGVPGQLNGMLKSSPGCQRPSVNIELAVLRVSPGEFTLILLLEVAAAVHMIEGEVPNGAPAVRYQDRWREARHSLL